MIKHLTQQIKHTIVSKFNYIVDTMAKERFERNEASFKSIFKDIFHQLDDKQFDFEIHNICSMDDAGNLTYFESWLKLLKFIKQNNINTLYIFDKYKKLFILQNKKKNISLSESLSKHYRVSSDGSNYYVIGTYSGSYDGSCSSDGGSSCD